MATPISDMRSAFTASLSLLGRSATHWLPPVVILSWFGAIPQAMTEYYLADLLALLTDPGAVEATLTGGTYLIAAVVLTQLVLQLVAILWAFLVLADVAASRDINLRAGLRRTLSLPLQFSWLLSMFIVNCATSTWWLGGCLLLLPFGFAVVDAYETGSGMGAFRRSIRLGLTRSPDKHGSPLAWPIVGMSTLVLATTALLSCGASCISFLVPGASSGPSLADLLALASSVDLSRPEELLPAILRTLTPEPSLGRAVSTLLLAPADTLIWVFLLALQIAVYRHAVQATASRSEGENT